MTHSRLLFIYLFYYIVVVFWQMNDSFTQHGVSSDHGKVELPQLYFIWDEILISNEFSILPDTNDYTKQNPRRVQDSNLHYLLHCIWIWEYIGVPIVTQCHMNNSTQVTPSGTRTRGQQTWRKGTWPCRKYPCITSAGCGLDFRVG